MGSHVKNLAESDNDHAAAQGASSGVGRQGEH